MSHASCTVDPQRTHCELATRSADCQNSNGTRAHSMRFLTCGRRAARAADLQKQVAVPTDPSEVVTEILTAPCRVKVHECKSPSSTAVKHGSPAWLHHWRLPTGLSTKTVSLAHWPLRQAATGTKCRPHQTSAQSLKLLRRLFPRVHRPRFQSSNVNRILVIPHHRLAFLVKQPGQRRNWVRVLVPPRVSRPDTQYRFHNTER